MFKFPLHMAVSCVMHQWYVQALLYESGQVCYFKGHNNSHCPVSALEDPFHMPRSIPVQPLLFPGAGNTLTADSLPENLLSVQPEGSESANGVSEIHPFCFAKKVPPALAADYTKRHWELQIPQELEASRAENKRCIKHAVLLIAYLLPDGGPPTLLPLQDIKMWPSNSPVSLFNLGLRTVMTWSSMSRVLMENSGLQRLITQ